MERDDLLTAILRTRAVHRTVHYGPHYVSMTRDRLDEVVPKVGLPKGTPPTQADRLFGMRIVIDPMLPPVPGFEIRSDL